MISYKTCKEVTMDQVFEAFSLGYSDYVVPVKMSQEFFEARFFGPEGNSLDLSFIAFDDEKPVGLILGGIRQFDGLKTMRCGTLCVGPDYRGQGISNKLFEMHKAAAIENNCKQMFLEVITTNHRAVKFYEKLEYRQVYNLRYYSCMTQALLEPLHSNPYDINSISFDAIDSFRKSLNDCHINWQSDTPSYSGSSDEALLCAYDGSKQIAYVAMSPQGKVNFLWVDKAYRNMGLGAAMLQNAAAAQKVEKINICIPSNSLLEGFVRKLKFNKEPVEQYEMYLPL
ncbi:MAG: GNAT family N-acetyltransferase [Bacillota bacterium]